MSATVVAYARFVQVQQRRARIIAELERPPATPASREEGRTVIDLPMDVAESPTPVDDARPRADVDVR